jgi:hypothetical protein
MDHDFSFLSTVCFYRHVFKWFLSVHQDKNFGAIEKFCIIRTGGPKKLGHIKKNYDLQAHISMILIIPSLRLLSPTKFAIFAFNWLISETSV